MGLSEEQIANAIGICMSHTLPMAILDSDREENFMAKNIRFGWAAHDAILACMLAKRGFTGPVRVIESDTGKAVYTSPSRNARIERNQRHRLAIQARKVHTGPREPSLAAASPTTT